MPFYTQSDQLDFLPNRELFDSDELIAIVPHDDSLVDLPSLVWIGSPLMRLDLGYPREICIYDRATFERRVAKHYSPTTRSKFIAACIPIGDRDSLGMRLAELAGEYGHYMFEGDTAELDRMFALPDPRSPLNDTGHYS